MSLHVNELGQPIGFSLDDWNGCPHPRGTSMEGRLCRIEPLDVERHASELFTVFAEDVDGRDWTYLPYGPFANEEDFRTWMSANCLADDPCFFAVVDARNDRTVGMASYLRIQPGVGVIEVGHIHFSPPMQRRPIATEVMYLMMRQVFEAWGYRRYEWKCDALNAPSRAAAERLGFLFEGIFRQATIYKQRNRDTAWYSILDREWPRAKAAFEAWMKPSNFDADGNQHRSLTAGMRAALAPLRQAPS